MKKLFVILLALTLVVSLAACSGEKTSAQDSSNARQPNESGSAGGPAGGSKAGDPPNFSEGAEFTAFVNAYDAVSDLYNSYFDDPEEYSENFDFIMANLDRIMLVDGNFLNLLLYDTYSDGFHAASNEGFFRIPFGFTKTRSGDTVSVVIDSAYQAMADDSGVYTDGDHRKMSAVLDKNKLTVNVEDSFSRNGSVYKRSVFEIARLDDGAFLAQNLAVTVNLDWDNISSSAVFHRIDTNGYVMVITEFEDPNVDFAYTSIVDKVDRDPERMAQNYKVTSVFKVENSKMTFESMK